MTTVTLPLEEERVLRGLKSGDEGIFASLVDMYNGPLLRVALVYVRDRAVAEEVVQETWLGVIRGIDRFEGRSSLKTWIFRILANTAKTRGERERRTVPFSAMNGAGPAEPAVEPERFLDGDHPTWPGHWASAPASWEDVPEDRLLAGETLDRIREAIAELPATQAQVITLRDVEGWSAEEVCDLLAISEGNQRVLLHRGRSKVRRALEDYLEST